MSMVKRALDEGEGKNSFRFELPNFRGFNSPKVKLDADISVAQESPEKETKEDIESLDNRDNPKPLLCCDRTGSAPWLDGDASSMLFKLANESEDSDSLRSALFAEFLLLRSPNKEEVKELRPPRRVLPNGLLLLFGIPSCPV